MKVKIKVYGENLREKKEYEFESNVFEWPFSQMIAIGDFMEFEELYPFMNGGISRFGGQVTDSLECITDHVYIKLDYKCFTVHNGEPVIELYFMDGAEF